MGGWAKDSHSSSFKDMGLISLVPVHERDCWQFSSGLFEFEVLLSRLFSCAFVPSSLHLGKRGCSGPVSPQIEKQAAKKNYYFYVFAMYSLIFALSFSLFLTKS